MVGQTGNLLTTFVLSLDVSWVGQFAPYSHLQCSGSSQALPLLASSPSEAHRNEWDQFSRTSSTVLLRQGAGPSLLTAIGNIRGEECWVNTPALMLSGSVFSCIPNHRVNFIVLPRWGANPRWGVKPSIRSVSQLWGSIQRGEGQAITDTVKDWDRSALQSSNYPCANTGHWQ